MQADKSARECRGTPAPRGVPVELDLCNGDRRQVRGLERRVEAGEFTTLHCRPLRFDFLELAVEPVDACNLIVRWPGLDRSDGPIDVVGILAQALLARNRSALLGGDDLLAQRI